MRRNLHSWQLVLGFVGLAVVGCGGTKQEALDTSALPTTSTSAEPLYLETPSGVKAPEKVVLPPQNEPPAAEPLPVAPTPAASASSSH